MAGLTVLRDRRLVDPAVPAVVTRDGRSVYEAIVPARLSVILETATTGGDARLVFDRAVRIP